MLRNAKTQNPFTSSDEREPKPSIYTRQYSPHARLVLSRIRFFYNTFSLFPFLFHKTLRFLRATVYALGFRNLEVIREDHFRALKVLY
ncbi:hypothetical protein MRB53_029501 [Persea americana]|uniref:Uncharacterized protein n=1 Tax=Persea americana TaxID=3435 RepID=A0ACC2KJM5_PERAE|nr:hypothetical protein MRB53_029501 [Persea americana]